MMVGATPNHRLTLIGCVSNSELRVLSLTFYSTDYAVDGYFFIFTFLNSRRLLFWSGTDDPDNPTTDLTAERPSYSQLLIIRKGDQKPGCS
jgi:hypothetical protein